MILDIALGGAHAWAHRAGSARAAVTSVLLWSALHALAGRGKVARAIVATFAALLVVLVAFTYAYVRVPFDLQVAEAARHSYLAIRPVLVRVLPLGAGAFVLVAAAELALLGIARWRAPVKTQVGLVLAAALAVVLGPEPRVSAPDVRALNAVRVFQRPPPARVAGAVALPALHTSRREMPDVLFVLTESVRAVDYLPREPDATAPESAAATPGRFELDELRATSSYTAVSLSAIITGLSQEGKRSDILEAPNLFDFAHAARADVGYYSAQSRETFETKDVRAAVDRFMTLETIAGHDVEDDSEWVKQPLDRMVMDRYLAELPARGHPSLTVLHLYGTHAPYYFEDERAKFAPYERSVGWSGMPKLRNAYRNSILEQDRQVARAIRAFITQAGTRPWIVVFTSDHGEAFGEHSAIHHGQNLYDEQIRVPGWMAASEGALTDAERRALTDHHARFVTHLDLLPTLLDAMGLLDDFSVRTPVGRLAGHSLLRAYVPRAPVPITNCTGMFPCPLDTWGVLGEGQKLVAQAWDGEWRCLGLQGGERLLPREECAVLGEASRRYFPRLPNGAPNR